MAVEMQTPEAASIEAMSQCGLHHKHLIRSCPGAGTPWVLLVHGRAGNFDVMWIFRRIIPEDWSIIAVQAPIPDSIGGYSWWPVQSNTDVSESAQGSAALLERFIERAANFYGLSNSVLALGFSQGGAALSVLVQRRRHLLLGMGMLASFVIPMPQLMPSGEDLAHPYSPIFMAHGTEDDVVTLERAQRGRDTLIAEGFEVEWHEDQVGHKIGSSALRALKAWLSVHSESRISEVRESGE